VKVNELIYDLNLIRQKCSDKLTDLDEVEEELSIIIEELKISKDK